MPDLTPFDNKDTEENASKKRNELLSRPRTKKPRKIAWVSKWDPDKDKIIRNNIHLLYRNTENRTIFPEGMLIAANRRRPNQVNLLNPQYQEDL